MGKITFTFTLHYKNNEHLAQNQINFDEIPKVNTLKDLQQLLWDEDHRINYEYVEVLATTTHYHQTLFRESLEFMEKFE